MLINQTETAAILLNSDNILLLSHSHPDGDTLGSATALAHALSTMGKKVCVKCGDRIPAAYNFMFEDLDSPEFEPELIVAIDVADEKLLGEEFDGIYRGKIDLCIDHHGSNLHYAKKLCLEAAYASTAEIVYNLLGIMNAPVTPVMASALFAGVSTDTGCFRFSNTTAQTHRIAAALIDAGADTRMIIQVFFETKTRSFAALERLANDSMKMYFDGKCAVITVTQDMFRRSGSDETETDRIANIPRRIEGVLVGVMLRELKDGGYKASVRTNGDIDASAICKRLGGGGHRGAGGCTLYGSQQQAANTLLKEVEVQLNQYSSAERD